MYFKNPDKRTGLSRQIKEILHFRHLLVELIRSEIKLRYRGSFIGVAWTVLNPILYSCVLYFLFRAIFRFRTLGDTDFFPYVYSGVLLLNFITRAIIEGSEQIYVFASTLRRVRLPAEIFVISKVLGNLLNLLIGLVPLFFYLLQTQSTLRFSFVLIPIVILPVFIIVCSASIFLSVIYIFFRDMQHLVPTALNLLFYLSPVFYSIDLIGGDTRKIIALNPLNTYLDAFRFTIGAGENLHLPYLFFSSILGLFLLILSFKYMERNRAKVVLTT